MYWKCRKDDGPVGRPQPRRASELNKASGYPDPSYRRRPVSRGETPRRPPAMARAAPRPLFGREDREDERRRVRPRLGSCSDPGVSPAPSRRTRSVAFTNIAAVVECGAAHRHSLFAPLRAPSRASREPRMRVQSPALGWETPTLTETGAAPWSSNRCPELDVAPCGASELGLPRNSGNCPPGPGRGPAP